jgi:hypothetical protein
LHFARRIQLNENNKIRDDGGEKLEKKLLKICKYFLLTVNIIERSIVKKLAAVNVNFADSTWNEKN